MYLIQIYPSQEILSSLKNIGYEVCNLAKSPEVTSIINVKTTITSEKQDFYFIDYLHIKS